MLTERLKKFVPVNAPALDRGDKNAAVISVAASKGGVGKTTTAVSLAAGLARFHGRRVLLVDLDSQAHIATAFRSAPPTDRPSVSSVLLGKSRGLLDLLDRCCLLLLRLDRNFGCS